MSVRGTRPKGRPVPGATPARRTPFVLLVVVLLGSGLIALLLLNSSLNQGSFELSKLEKQTNELTDERQALQQDVDKLSAPAELERRARQLGMVPGGNPVFLNPDGSVSGVPAPVTGQPSVLGAPGAVLPSAPDPAPSTRYGSSPTPSVLAPPAQPTATPSGAGAGTASATPSVTPWAPPTGVSASASHSASVSASAEATPDPQ
ncbi:septum formation initiator family protein [Streptomyces malaysiensis]|uniref:septum formation initiator family protein n=1 Tax=Streptomyces malaysiensis TaxID=92644 RepID=UPI000852E6E2|nr:septum formation initiator family protein [Streptomyces sp. SPMA113]